MTMGPVHNSEQARKFEELVRTRAVANTIVLEDKIGQLGRMRLEPVLAVRRWPEQAERKPVVCKKQGPGQLHNFAAVGRTRTVQPHSFAEELGRGKRQVLARKRELEAEAA